MQIVNRIFWYVRVELVTSNLELFLKVRQNPSRTQVSGADFGQSHGYILNRMTFGGHLTASIWVEICLACQVLVSFAEAFVETTQNALIST